MIAGRLFSTAVAVIFIIGAYAQFTFDPAAEVNQATVQFPAWFHTANALSLVFAALLHMVPNSSFATLGAILMTDMIGGMIGSLLLQENSLWWTRAVIGALPWLGLYLRVPEFNNLMNFWRGLVKDRSLTRNRMTDQASTII